MAEVKFQNDGAEPDEFNLFDQDKKIGEMIVETIGDNLKVYHTEVDDDQAGKGYAKKLLDAMADYARSNQLKVIPLCSYVALQFKRHPDEYEDIWNKSVKPEF
ncbi:GNAT family N-acetyltransferase [Pedobacter sp. CFBP9032]|uniref:GNAT family N-acetyltransferase n=1 Tax=Pedobacter sp. CFBP9032 TaxID=3096539 RepID=UPI002A69B485|nr:GNAT family N-acetyltransferase [Pedobacter sp. CFBP9032]MDY0906481.1 GNAT family N-acetyltransferase [Pedobacter sp. CFBP9032]